MQLLLKLRYDVCDLSRDHVIKCLYHRSHKIWSTYSIFFKLLHDNMKYWYYKVKQLIQNETENGYEKNMTKCVRFYKKRQVLQSVSGTTK